MKMPTLSLTDLSTGYRSGHKRLVVANGLNASLPPASLTAIIGGNGTGKSTLMRTLAGLQPALGGEIRWMGHLLGDYEPMELAKTVALVLTRRAESEMLTVQDVVSMGRVPYTDYSGRLKAADRTAVAQAMAQMGIEAWAGRRLTTLSDGERQRVMIAKALAQQTPAIMLDEPTAFLDFAGKAALLKLLESLAREHGKTILFSTHDLELTFQLVRRLWVVSKDGLTEGSPQELAADGTLSSVFAGNGISFDAAQMRFSINQ